MSQFLMALWVLRKCEAFCSTGSWEGPSHRCQLLGAPVFPGLWPHHSDLTPGSHGLFLCVYLCLIFLKSTAISSQDGERITSTKTPLLNESWSPVLNGREFWGHHPAHCVGHPTTCIAGM